VKRRIQVKTQALIGFWLLVGVGCGPEEVLGVGNTSETAIPTEPTTSKGSGGRGMTGGGSAGANAMGGRVVSGGATSTGMGGAASGGHLSAMGGSASGGRGNPTGGAGDMGGAGALHATPAQIVNLGRPCVVGGDCESGLFCNFDLLTRASHRQCTTSCNATSDCVSFFDPAAHCDTVRKVCIKGCIRTADCPQGAVCGPTQTCDRPAACVGVATACSLLPSPSCGNTPGCSVAKTCDGVATPCASVFQCDFQSGCYSDYYSYACLGTPTACFIYGSDTLTCQSQAGCGLVDLPFCSGTASSCQSVTPEQCALNPGCHLD